MAFLPEDFVVPTLVAGLRFRIRPITVHDVVRVFDAVTSSREGLWNQFGEVRGWPAEDLTLEDCLIDVAWQQKQATLRRSFVFAVMTTDESRLLGCIYLGPPAATEGLEAEVAFWVRASEADSGLDKEIDEFVREWVETAWPFKEVRLPGGEACWAEWGFLPALPG
ncbi:MAG: hypothetical protein QOE54_3744 [Streptosporangiaceae bacterium]|nr:hypothetical protein [Streptosporangiaceae bacterium]MDX6431378.1 hypothetical protein [Streptosporangiaceae bacterium]